MTELEWIGYSLVKDFSIMANYRMVLKRELKSADALAPNHF